MGLAAVTVVLATVFFWCVFSSRAERTGLSVPIVFVTAGFVYAEVIDVFDPAVEPELVKLIAEVTLVWVLFADASGCRPASFAVTSACMRGCSEWAYRAGAAAAGRRSSTLGNVQADRSRLRGSCGTSVPRCPLGSPR